MRRSKYPAYEERFLRFSQSVEKWLIFVVFLFLLSLLITQILLHVDFFRHMMVEVERLEGIAS